MSVSKYWGGSVLSARGMCPFLMQTGRKKDSWTDIYFQQPPFYWCWHFCWEYSFFQHCLTAAEGKQVAKRSHKLQLVDLLRASYNISHIWEFTWTIPSGHFSLGTMTSPEMMKKTHCIIFTKIDWSTNPVKLVSEVGSNPPRIHAGILKYEIVNLITTKSY